MTATLERKRSHPETSPDFDRHKAVNDVLADVGMSVVDGGAASPGFRSAFSTRLTPRATAGSTEGRSYVAPDLFTAETAWGTYQGMTDQVVMSRTPGSFSTMLVPRGSCKPEWRE